MSILEAILLVFIGPLKLFFSVIYALAFRIIGNPGLTIIVLSLVMNFLVLPLYRRADAMQAEERDMEARLQPMITHIKKTFIGDERFMMLQAYYRENNYNPAFALKGSLSLLLEIPFFIAAYQFLSGLQLLNGVSFGPIRDLGTPDALLTIGGLSINLLPILMTLINIVSGAIYTKGFSLKSKIQLYGMALIFLIFLYRSPAGLVFYWTLNNVFSLVKNVFYKLKDPGKVLVVLASLAGAASVVFGLASHASFSSKKMIFFILLGLLLQLPLVFRFRKARPVEGKAQLPENKLLFILGCSCLTILTGLLIPTAVIRSSPAEFIDVFHYQNPLFYAGYTVLIAAGTFLVWFVIFYYLAERRVKKMLEKGILIAVVVSLVDYMAFGTKLGNLSTVLRYDTLPVYARSDILLNLLVIAAVAAGCLMLVRWKEKLVPYLLVVGVVAVAGMGIVNLAGIGKGLQGIREAAVKEAEEVPEIRLSRNGKNVVVLMMDRAIGTYIPYLFNEKPELESQFDGFTYFPNTISYGPHTNFGSPALFGGYDYKPEHINERSNESLADKQNEALKVMPELFYKNGFEVTVCDPTYAGYGWISDLSIYDDYPDMHTYITTGRYGKYALDASEKEDALRKRNFFCYSLYRIAPVILKGTLYNVGMYNDADANVRQQALAQEVEAHGNTEVSAVQTRYGISKSDGMDILFLSAYAVLENLQNITTIEEGDTNTFLMMSNDTTHDPMLLQEPEYVPAEHVDNTLYDAEHTERFTVDGKTLHMDSDEQMIHYHVNMAGIIQLGKWFDYLREAGVWANTRIIVVADHGRGLEQRDDLIMEDGQDIMYFSPLFMIKDFDSTGFTVDEQFMTNADTPALAMNDLLQDPVNPFTGNAINSLPKQGEQRVFYSDIWNTYENNGNVFLPGTWYTVHDDMRDAANWKLLEEE